MAARVPRPVPPALVVHLAPMRRRHLRAVMRIESQVYPRPWSLTLFMSELALRTTRAYTVARVDGTVVGYSGLMLAGDDAHVTTIAVDPAWHRRGIGSRLLLNMARTAAARGAGHLTLEVRVGNEAAQVLYRRFGFYPAGVRKNYYAETNEDALVMWVDDIATPEYRERLAQIETAISGSTVVEGPVDGSERLGITEAEPEGSEGKAGRAGTEAKAGTGDETGTESTGGGGGA